MAKCGAKTRNGTRCQRNAMPNGRCNLHGGKSTGAPRDKMKGKQNALKHGFFARIFPDDQETKDIIASINAKSPIEILWENIVIQYTAIVRAQKLMFVQDKSDETKVLTKLKGERVTNDEGIVVAEVVTEEEWEYQHAWDKHGEFMKAQSRAIATLESLLARYEEMLPNSLRMEEQRLKIEKLRAEIDRVKNPEGDHVEDWISALEVVAARRAKKRGENDG